MLTPYQRSRGLLAIGLVGCFTVLWQAARWLGIPFVPGHSDTIVYHPWAYLAIPGALVAFGVAVTLGTIIVGRYRGEAGFFVACLGLTAFTLRGGTLGDMLQMHPYPGVYWMLIVESLLWLAAMVGGSWIVRRMPWAGPAVGDGEPLDDTALAEVRHPVGTAVAAVAAQLLVTAAGVWLLAPTDEKAQVLVAVFAASAAGTAIGGRFFQGPKWIVTTCAGPLVVGMLGYAMAWADPKGLEIALSGVPLARPLPIDWASAGCAGAILGGWMGAEYHIHWIDQMVAKATGRDWAPEAAGQ